MIRRRQLTALVVTLLGLAVLLAAGATFRQRILEEWYLWRLDSENAETCETAATALGEIGTARAIPALMEVNLRYARATWKDGMSVTVSDRAFPHQSELEALLSMSGDERIREGLLESYRTSLRKNSPLECYDSLLRLAGREGVAGIACLTDFLSHDDWRARAQAALLLAGLGPKAKAAIRQLEATAEDDPHPVVRRLAFDAVFQIHSRDGRGPNLLVPRGDPSRYNGLLYDGVYPRPPSSVSW